MNGTHDPLQERLRRRAEEELRARPVLPTWQNRVLQRFAVERGNGWYALLNQFAPTTPENRPDAVLAGPKGVFVVLLRDREPDWEISRAAFVWTSELLAGAATPHGLLTESVLRTVVVLPDARRGARNIGEHLVVTEGELDRVLLAGDDVLSPADALATAQHLDRRTFDLTPIVWKSQHIPEPRAPGQSALTSPPSGMFELSDLREARVVRALDGPFRNWRLFLDDAQAGTVRRQYNGPARITGPAGTGKSVLALHRLAYLARRTTGKLLFTTHVRLLPRIAAREFAALAPQVAHRVEFTNLHSWARNFLIERKRAADVDPAEVDAAFRAVWERVGRTGPLGTLRPSRTYWKDEIDRVIKGRAIRTLETYRSVARKGRGGKLTTAFRANVWEFYCEYERELSERGVYDYNDVLLHALDELEREPLPQQYDAVVVDEVQDLTLTGLLLAHAISGDGPNQLLLVGDGEQQVYAGGWRLSDANISLQGRGEILRHNYRNRAAIVELARELDTINRFDDLDGGPTITIRSSRAMLEGGQVVRWRGTEQEAALLEALRGLDDTTDVAVLTRTNKAAEHWEKRLRAAGFAVASLERWDGNAGPAILIGTVHRAKGAEFRVVFLPAEQHPGLIHRDERETLRRQRLAAVTRARDHVWLGTLLEP